MTTFKKHFYPFLTALGLLGVIIAITGLSPQTVRAGSGSKNIVFVRANFKPGPGSVMVDQFKTTLSKRGYVEGKNIRYTDISILGNDPAEAQKALKEVARLRADTDLFVTSGGISLAVRAQLAGRDIPQIFAPVLREEGLAMLPSLTEPPGTNLSGVYLNYPPENILRLVRLILPQIRNYAYVYDSHISTDRYLLSAYEQLPENKRLGISVHFLDLAGGEEQVLQQMTAQGIEAYGGLIGAYKNREVLARSGLPMITALLMDIDRNEIGGRIRESNILAGLYDPLDYCGELAGEMAADFLDGKKTIAATLPRPARHISFINLAAAVRHRIHIPYTALEAVDIVIK